MGDKGKQIVKMSVEELINQLNSAYADEWLAYYQYWVSAKVATGWRKEAAVREFEEHAQDELKHAGMLADRVIQLGGTPLSNMLELNAKANCKYANPADPDTVALLKQGVDGERCAIDVYGKMLNELKDKDPLTYHIILEILEDEVDHEEDFQSLLEDLEKRRGR
jgi:bacterioferritin